MPEDTASTVESRCSRRLAVGSQGCSIENTRLVVRYPDRRTQKALSIPLRASLPAVQQAAVQQAAG